MGTLANSMFANAFARLRRPALATLPVGAAPEVAAEADFPALNDRVMTFMRGHGETRTRTEIAKALGIATSTMSGVVNRLLRRGLLVEEPGKVTCTVTGNRVGGVSAA